MVLYNLSKSDLVSNTSDLNSINPAASKTNLRYIIIDASNVARE